MQRHPLRAVLIVVGTAIHTLLAANVAHAADMDYRLQPRKLADHAYALIGRTEDFDRNNGANIVNTGFFIGPSGVVVIDSGPSLRYGQQARKAIEALAPGKPIALVVDTHHHPDHFLGNQAYKDAPIGALPATTQSIHRDGNSFAENLYRMSGDWMLGTEALAPNRNLAAGPLAVGGLNLRLIAAAGHTGADLAVYEPASGVLFTGDLVFNLRAPTTPHADIAEWLGALDQMESITKEPGFKLLVPGHGEPSTDAAPIVRTRRWLLWLRGTLQDAAKAGMDMVELMRHPLPAEFADVPLAHSEFRRSVEHLYPEMEDAVLGKAMPQPAPPKPRY